MPLGQKSLFIPGCVQGAIILISLSVCPSVCVSSVCVTFVVFTDCESCTRAILPISTNPGSMEAGEYGQTLVTCFVARLLEVVAVAGLLWISCCVLGRADFSVFFFSICFFFFERTLPAAYMRPPCLIYLSASTGVRTGCHYLICLSVCVWCVTLDSSFLLIARAVRGRFSQTRDLWKRDSMG